MVGLAKARSVSFKLLVSFFIVRRVVEQGQWNSIKTMVLIAVTVVQPFSKNNARICESPLSVARVPRAE